MAKINVYEYTVVGKSLFPFDMLRYDQSWPTPEGASSLHHLFRNEHHHYGDDGQLLKIDQVEIKLLSNRPPTGDRWASFGWYIKDNHVEVRSY